MTRPETSQKWDLFTIREQRMYGGCVLDYGAQSAAESEFEKEEKGICNSRFSVISSTPASTLPHRIGKGVWG
jgi:hypothetical protein